MRIYRLAIFHGISSRPLVREVREILGEARKVSASTELPPIFAAMVVERMERKYTPRMVIASPYGHVERTVVVGRWQAWVGR